MLTRVLMNKREGSMFTFFNYLSSKRHLIVDNIGKNGDVLYRDLGLYTVF